MTVSRGFCFAQLFRSFDLWSSKLAMAFIYQIKLDADSILGPFYSLCLRVKDKVGYLRRAATMW